MRFDRDEAEYAAGLPDLPRRAAAAAELGSLRCSAHVWPGSDELDLDANLEFHAERLRPVAETLLLRGIRFEIDARAILKGLDQMYFAGPTLVEPFNAEVRALPPEGRVAAVAASLE